MPDIFELADQFRASVLRRERASASAMAGAYGLIWQRIKDDLDRLAKQIDQARANGETVGTSWLFQQARLKRLQAQVEAELRVFAQFAEQSIIAEQRAAVEAAQGHAQQLTLGSLGEPPPGAVVTFARLPRESVTDLVGFVGDGSGSPLRDLLDKLGPSASQSVRNALMTGLATGCNPREIAQTIRRELAGNLVRALVISRTEVLRSYREATLRNYQANDDIVKGWIWHAHRGPRTCPACLAMHGSEHTLEERLDDHVNGRCKMVPLTKSWEELGFPGVPDTRPKIERGADWFAGQPAEFQQKVLGPAAFAAYQAGAVKLTDFVGRRHSERWGTMRYARSLRQILGDEDARQWLLRALDVRTRPRSLGAAASLQAQRIAQLQRTAASAIDRIVTTIRGSKSIPEPGYHFRRHGPGMGLSTEADYVAALRQHLSRPDLRFFTYLRTRDRVPFWELIAPDGTTVLYNEERGRIWSFFRPSDPNARMAAAATWWIEVFRQDTQWQFRENWQWP